MVTEWFKILTDLEMKVYLNISNQSSVDSLINDILHQILDPCGMFEQITSLRHVKNDVYSIVDGNPAIYYSYVTFPRD